VWLGVACQLPTSPFLDNFRVADNPEVNRTVVRTEMSSAATGGAYVVHVNPMP
jgi:hypothetical protein